MDSAKKSGNKTKMPMKQHVRIVGGHGRSAGAQGCSMFLANFRMAIFVEIHLQPFILELGRDEYGSNP